MMGAIAPLFIFYGFSLIARARKMRLLELLSRAMCVYGAIYFVLGLGVSIPHRLEVLALLQPMRSLQLLYVLMLLFGGGLLGEYVLRNRVWRWVALFLPLSAGMCYAQRTLYPATTHIEWPGAAPANPWEQAFQWVRENTPEQAIFAINPKYMGIEGEDSQPVSAPLPSAANWRTAEKTEAWLKCFRRSATHGWRRCRRKPESKNSMRMISSGLEHDFLG